MDEENKKFTLGGKTFTEGSEISLSMVQQVTFTLESSQQLMLQSLVSSDVLAWA